HPQRDDSQTNAGFLRSNADSIASPNGLLSFYDGDPASGGYSFTISGTVNAPPPALTVKDGLTVLPNGSGSDDFGTTTMGVPVQKTFTIYNSSGNDVGLYGLANELPAGFSLVDDYFPSDVPPNGSATFTVQMDADLLRRKPAFV